MSKLPVICKQQKAFRILVQPAYRERFEGFEFIDIFRLGKNFSVEVLNLRESFNKSEGKTFLTATLKYKKNGQLTDFIKVIKENPAIRKITVR